MPASGLLIGYVRLGGNDHLSGNDDETLSRIDTDALGEPFEVGFAQLSADDGDVAVRQLPDIGATGIAGRCSQLVRRLAEPSQEIRRGLRVPPAGHRPLQHQQPVHRTSRESRAAKAPRFDAKLVNTGSPKPTNSLLNEHARNRTITGQILVRFEVGRKGRMVRLSAYHGGRRSGGCDADKSTTFPGVT